MIVQCSHCDLVSGRTCYVHQHCPGLDKLDLKAIKCIFLGLSYTERLSVLYSYSPSIFSAYVTYFGSILFTLIFFIDKRLTKNTNGRRTKNFISSIVVNNQMWIDPQSIRS